MSKLEFDDIVEQGGLEALRQYFPKLGTTNLNFEDIECIEDKHDGSLISTFLHNGQLRVKSKGSLFSEQAINSAQWLMAKENDEYRHQLYLATDDNFTVDLEWTSPDNRIVLGYEKPQLIMLHMRCNETGEMYHFDDMEKMKNWIAIRHVQYYPPVDTNGLTLTEFINQVPSMTGIEGYVLRFKNRQYAKLKTDWYCSLHHTKDSINNPRRLFEAIIDEAVDDLRSMFYDDPYSIKTIDDMQAKVDHIFNNMVNTVEEFYSSNKQLERKDYAVKGQTELDKRYFSLAMNLYLGKDPNYKEYLKSKYKLFGIKDEKIEPE